jgi:5,10-methylenetetrahydromethanopterin reductase
MLKLAAEVADGVLVNASHPYDLRDALNHLREAPVTARTFDTVAYLAVSVGADLEHARRLVRGIVAFIAASAPKTSLDYHEIPARDVESVRKWLRVGEIAKARESVTQRMIDAFSVCGSISDLESRLEEVRSLGYSTAVIGSPIGPDPYLVLRRARILL